MSNTVEELKESQPMQPALPSVKPLDGPEYSIYNYSRKNTGFTIAVISALVAIATFSLNYATTLYNHAYLKFWNIDFVYAKSQDIGVFYTAFGVFVYYFLMMFSQVLVGTTASVYAHYNKVFLVWKSLCRQLKRKKNKYLLIRKKQYKLLRKVKTDHTNIQQIKTKIDEVNIKIDKINKNLNDKKDIRAYKTRLTINLVVTCSLSVLLCLIGSVVLTVSYEDKTKFFMIGLLSLFPTFFSLVLHFIPNCRRVQPDEFMEKDLQKYKDEAKGKRLPLFPIEGLLHGGFKYHATNNKIIVLAVQYIVTIVLCIFVLANAGKHSAEQKKDFPIWRDGSTAYAVIYNNGTQIILEPIIIDGDCATIDTSTQRILTSNDITYEIQSFEKKTVSNRKIY